MDSIDGKWVRTEPKAPSNQSSHQVLVRCGCEDGSKSDVVIPSENTVAEEDGLKKIAPSLECRLESSSGMVHGEMDAFTKEGRLQKPMVDSLNDPATVKMSNLAEGYSVRSAEKEGALKEPGNDSVSTVDDQRMGRSHENLHEKLLWLNGFQHQQSETPPRCNNKVGVGKNVGPFSSPIKRGRGRPRNSQKTNPNPSDAGVKRIKGDGAAADQVVESPKTNRLETGGTGIGDGIADDAVAVEDPGTNRADSREQVEKLLPLKIEREEVLLGKPRWCITKNSPLWNTVEAMEAFKLFPQVPHFGPLERLNDEFQEGLAIGHMVTFSSLVDKALKLRPDDPLTSFDSILKALMELERHGFEVGPMRWRVDGLLVLKMKYERLMELSRGVQGRIVENQRKEAGAEEEIGVIEREMEELVVRRVTIASKKVAWESETGLLQAKAKTIDEELQLAHHDFQGMVARWW